MRDRLLLSAVGLPETERLGDLTFSTPLGVGERLRDFECGGELASNGSDTSFESFGFGDAERDPSEASEFADLFISAESFMDGDADRDLTSDNGLPDRELPCSLLSGLIGVSI